MHVILRNFGALEVEKGHISCYLINLVFISNQKWIYIEIVVINDSMYIGAYSLATTHWPFDRRSARGQLSERTSTTIT